MRVVILGSHPSNGYSMLRFTELLLAAYQVSGHEVYVLRPTNLLSKKIQNKRFKKLVVYFEKLLIFPLRLLFNFSKPDVLHVADHSDAIWLLWPLRTQNRIVTCHDLIAVRASMGEIPEFQPKVSGRLYQKFIIKGLHNSSLIEAVSEATQLDVMRIIQHVPCVLVHLPQDPSMAKLATQEPKPRLNYSFALIVSSSGWRKRRGHAIQVWQRLKSEPGWEALQLVVIGPPLTPEEYGLTPTNLKEQVFEVSDVSEDLLSVLYSEAKVLLQVSKYEGFGWPIIEANLFGTPAICSDIPVFREVGEGNFFISEELDQVPWTSITSWLSSPESSFRALSNASKYSMSNFSKRLDEILTVKQVGKNSQ